MFHLAGVFNLVDDKLSVSTDLRVIGAIEDPNRLVDYRGYREAPAGYMAGGVPINEGTIIDPMGNPAPAGVRTAASDLVMDRLPPAADLSLGVTYTPTEKLVVRGSVFNARYYGRRSLLRAAPRVLTQPWEDWHRLGEYTIEGLWGRSPRPSINSR
jgi:hypothetical protein